MAGHVMQVPVVGAERSVEPDRVVEAHTGQVVANRTFDVS